MNLKIIPKFTGKDYNDLEEIINDKRAKGLLWAEILLNDSLDWEKYKLLIEEDYRKACIYYTNFKYLLRNRKPLEEIKAKVDNNELRRFEEILRIAIN